MSAISTRRWGHFRLQTRIGCEGRAVGISTGKIPKISILTGSAHAVAYRCLVLKSACFGPVLMVLG